MMLLQPQEVEVYYILPTIRKEFARAMKAAGKSQKEIASILGVTGAAVSQYFSEKRGQHVNLPASFQKEIEESVKKIIDTQTMIQETQRIVQLAKDQKIICQLHEKLEGSIPKGCDACFK